MQQRAYDETSNADLVEHGGGEVYPLLYSDKASNGNMLESNSIAKRHFVCGDPKLVSARFSPLVGVFEFPTLCRVSQAIF